MWSKKRLLGAFAALVAACLIGVGGGYYHGHNKGVVDGVDMYHKACYTGGIIINPDDGSIVACKPLGVLPKQEVDNFVKKSLTNTP